MERAIIVEGLNQVYQEKKRYDGNMRDFESKGRKVATYGAAGLAFGVLGLAFTYLYRKYTDRCKNLCGDNSICFNKCYADACKKVLIAIDAEVSKAKKIPDDKKRQKTLDKLAKEKRIWSERLARYNARLKG